MSHWHHLVDSHFHSESLRQKSLSPEDCLAAFFNGGGENALDVAINVENWASRVALSKVFPGVHLTAGIHPGETERLDDDDWLKLEAQLKDPRTVALGEVGLDWYRGRNFEAAQRELLHRQLVLARSLSLPVVIHNREADLDILAELDRAGWTEGGVFHCFSSDFPFAKKILDRGFYISFAGNLTYSSSRALRETAAQIPLSRLLLETDSPYLSPQSRRGKPNQPLFLTETAEVLASLQNLPVQELLNSVADNYRRAFPGVIGREQ